MGLWVFCESMQRTVNMNRTPSCISMYNYKQKKKNKPQKQNAKICPNFLMTGFLHVLSLTNSNLV